MFVCFKTEVGTFCGWRAKPYFWLIVFLVSLFYVLVLCDTCLFSFQSSSRLSCAYTRVAGKYLTSSKEFFDSAILPRRGGKVQKEGQAYCLFSVTRHKRPCDEISIMAYHKLPLISQKILPVISPPPLAFLVFNICFMTMF